MADKRPVQGVVQETSVNGKTQMKIAGTWYVMSPKVVSEGRVSLPPVGATVAFDAYGRDFDIFYRYTSSAGQQNVPTMLQQAVASVPVGPAGVPLNPYTPRDQLVGIGNRRAALDAAATVLAGSEGTPSVIAGNVIQLSQILEEYLRAELA